MKLKLAMPNQLLYCRSNDKNKTCWVEGAQEKTSKCFFFLYVYKYIERGVRLEYMYYIKKGFQINECVVGFRRSYILCNRMLPRPTLFHCTSVSVSIKQILWPRNTCRIVGASHVLFYPIHACRINHFPFALPFSCKKWFSVSFA